MRRASLAVVVVLATAGGASGASADRTVPSPERVLALARSEFSVAWLSAPSKGHCGPTVHLWNLNNSGTYVLGRHPDAFCEGGDPSSGATDLAVAGNRVVWLAYVGREWQLFTATTTSPTERQLERQTSDPDTDEPPFVLGVGSGSVIPYSVGSRVTVLAADGHQLYTWHAPARVTNTTAYNSQVAVFVLGGRCFVLAPSGAVLQTYTFRPGSVQEFALGGKGLVVQLPGGRIEIHNGNNVRTLSIPPQAKMLDYADNMLLYRVGNAVHGRFVGSGKDALLRRATIATLEHNGLSYAVGKHVYSVAWVNVTAAINRL
jgi:hypothetical protein